MDKLAIQFTVELLRQGKTAEATTFIEVYASESRHVVDNCFPEWKRFKREFGPFKHVYERALKEQYGGSRRVATVAAETAQQLWEGEL